jgi:DNA polymerase-1
MFYKTRPINSKGMDTSAIMGFMSNGCHQRKPDHLAVAFEGGSDLRNDHFSL